MPVRHIPEGYSAVTPYLIVKGGADAIDFYTEKKVVVERWPSTWSRRF